MVEKVGVGVEGLGVEASGVAQTETQERRSLERRLRVMKLLSRHGNSDYPFMEKLRLIIFLRDFRLAERVVEVVEIKVVVLVLTPSEMINPCFCFLCTSWSD